MTDANTAAQNDTTNTADRKEWPQRFGTMKKLDIKSGRNGEFGVVTIDCGKFEQTAFIFNAGVLAKAKTAATKAHKAGLVAKIWLKGPIESVDRGGFSKDEMKAVYFKDNTEYANSDAPAAEDDAAVSDATAADPVAADLDDEIPF